MTNIERLLDHIKLAAADRDWQQVSDIDKELRADVTSMIAETPHTDRLAALDQLRQAMQLYQEVMSECIQHQSELRSEVTTASNRNKAAQAYLNSH